MVRAHLALHFKAKLTGSGHGAVGKLARLPLLRPGMQRLFLLRHGEISQGSVSFCESHTSICSAYGTVSAWRTLTWPV
jgi:hypothetical protein